MDKWTTLEPVKLHGPNRQSRLPPVNRYTFIGPFPPEVHVRILAHLPIPSLPACARVSRAFSRLVRDDRVWKRKYDALGIAHFELDPAIDALESVSQVQRSAQSAEAAAPVPAEEDDFGDFASAPLSGAQEPRLMVSEYGDFVVAGGSKPTTEFPSPPVTSLYAQYLRVHRLLTPLLSALLASPHLVLPTLFPEGADPMPRSLQAKILHLLARFLGPIVQPTLNWPNARRALMATLDRFDGALLTAFDAADGQADEGGMRDCAMASWEAWVALDDERIGDEWEMGRTWAEKRGIFYEHGKWDPTANITSTGELDFSPMDKFMSHVLETVEKHGALATRVFPSASRVLPSFADRLANDVIGEYIAPLLSKARESSTLLYLQAAAASFVQAWRLVDATRKAAGKDDKVISQTQAEDIMGGSDFESKITFDQICKAWERKLDVQTQSISSAAVTTPTTQARFLGSHNPAQVKRTVLTSFTNVLLLPVTIVPRVGEQIGSAAVTGFGMLNPQRWSQNSRTDPSGAYRTPVGERDGDGGMLFEIEEEDDKGEKDDDGFGKLPSSKDQDPWASENKRKSEAASVASRPVSVATTRSQPQSRPRTSTVTSSMTNRSSIMSGSSGPGMTFDELDLLLSLDTALELVHADREALKRCETFKEYPAPYGHRVRETIEELFILMLQAMGDRHIAPGFAKAAEQMRTYQPAEHAETTSVAPLLQFFELAHIGDTIQSIIQVYFDKELAPFIDKTDFLNAVVREKKRFENALDDAVAGGLNAGTEVLMNQVEHIIISRTGPRVYYPDPGVPLELGPTKGCQEAIACLEMHCKLLKGSTSKEVLEVFHQEIGIRLNAILQKHLKRQIISLEGGFQVIADLNAYHTFITSLKVPSIQQDFANLKMLGHVYVVEDAVDLAQIVRDVTRYGGSFRPEDVYEFIQRRSDWKKIEKTVDKTMYNLSFKEDCVIC
ncbi:Recyclin-1 [Saccharomyces cerevisiae S288c] [Rhizoctonia solani]|uniref:Recyclin-1 [Saccharomyces cerevisiae S288c] n=1 Tax=Rhizoctonia solani TaxID=456999 RepID=A0A0K6FQA4_9AGAM|nr:Recyclin-1 [Saccharomyces cerevisiae S288c] [Rhizoctonia solani]